MKLTEEKVKKFYGIFKQEAQKCYWAEKYDSCLKYLEAACQTAYTFYLCFNDAQIECVLKDLSKHIHSNLDATTYPQCRNRVVLFDTFSQDTQGLTMQYLNAIIAGGYELMYMTEFGLDDPRSRIIKQTLQDYSNAIVETVPSALRGMKRAKYIYEKIYAYQPAKLFMHIHPSAVVPIVAFYALPKQITRYQINLTDHAYWVGRGCMDYTFEFRDYGANLSVSCRGFSLDKILMLPYYPMMKPTKFAGFPIEVESKVKIFAGSAYYKIIDQNDTFFKLNKAILDANPQTVTLFAGGGDAEFLNSLIRKYNLEGRFIPIGQRNDIFECYKHSDIYLSTFPLFGGLMGQFAAHAGLPILALEKKTGGSVEEVVCQKRHEYITLSEIEDVVAEATHLIQDPEYRKQRGLAMRDCVIDSEEFNKSFVQSIETNKSQYEFTYEKNVKLHYLDINNKLKLVNKNKDYHMFLFNIFGGKLLLSHPAIWMDGFKARIKNSRLGKYIK